MPQHERELAVVALLADSYDDLAKLEELGVELSDAEEIMLTYGFERCPECEMWVECGELVDEHGDGRGACCTCRPFSKDDD